MITMPNIDADAAAELLISDMSTPDSMVPRIIQYHGKRYCIRLEDIYWDVLEDEAKHKNCKLNEIVHLYYEDPRGCKNKTAFLRRQAIVWLTNKVDTANARLNLKNTELRAVLRATVQPAIVFSELQSVSRYNQAFRDWLTANMRPGSLAADFAKLRVSFRRSYEGIMELLEAGRGSANDEQSTILIPGYVFPVRINIVKLNSHADGEQLFLGIVNEV